MITALKELASDDYFCITIIKWLSMIDSEFSYFSSF